MLDLPTRSDDRIWSSPSRRSLILAFAPGFNRGFAERLLGRKRGAALSPATGKRLKKRIKRLEPLLRPRVLFRVERKKEAAGGKVVLTDGTRLNSPKLAWAMQGAEELVFFVATVGEGVDGEIKRLMGHGRYADAYVADALGSSAVERAADQFQQRFAAECRGERRSVGLRFSPGYCDWPLPEQRHIFSRLDAGEIGVQLLDTCLMQPAKSVSGVFGLYRGDDIPGAGLQGNPCLRCGKRDCIARRTS